MPVSLSIVIPVYNEVDSLPHLHAALTASLAEFAREVIYVDDGSRDGSVELLEQLVEEDAAHARAVLFRRNFGQTAALAAGIAQATGDIIVLMDADLQNDPADIPMLLDALRQGADVVCGWRQRRQDAFLTRKLPSRLANALIGRITGVRLHDYGCTLKAFRREVLTAFHLYGEMHRFIPAHAALVGAVIREAPVRHHARQFGKTKYGLGRTFRVLLDLLTQAFYARYATKPMHLFGGCGLFGIACGLLLLVATAIMCNALLLTPGIVLTVAGGQCLLVGLLAEMQMRTYHESQGKPPYHIRRVINPAMPPPVDAATPRNP